MDDRGQIFSEFQNFTGIEDAGRCFTILEEFNWNLQEAVQNALNQMDSTSFATTQTIPIIHNEPSTLDTVLAQSVSQPIPSSSSKLLNVFVEYRNVAKNVVISDSKTVGDLKAQLAETYKLPVADIELHGWLHKNDKLIRDTDWLKSLNLPKDNYLFILTPNIPVSSVQFNGSTEKKIFTITIKYLNKSICLRFPPEKTIKQFKQDVGYCLSVPLRFQNWVDMPQNIKFTNKTTLEESGLDRTSTLTLENANPNAANSSDNFIDLVSNEADSDSEPGELDTYGDEDLDDDHHYRSASKPLMPAFSSDQMAGTESFCREFALRYGEHHPIFYIGPLDNAVKDSLNCKAKDRKMLAIYLHHDASVFTNVFCSQVLCAESFISYLSANFICWPWDLTHSSNFTILLDTCSTHFGSVASSSISHRIDPPDRLPVILIIARHRGNNDVVEIIEGNSTLNETMSRLIHATEINTTQLEAEISEEVEREARGKVLAEQDAAYQESLALDRAKEDSRKKEDEERKKLLKQQEIEQQENMTKKIQEEKEKQAFQQLLANNLPDEPPLETDKSTISIKVRCPEGQTLSRRFYRSNHLSDLINFITSQGHHAEDYKLLTVYPRRDLTQQDPTSTFDELRLASKEAITLEKL